ncbi:MAG: TetR/AcrR family transcriptional regulator [Steroidobacteraceae bacterium]
MELPHENIFDFHLCAPLRYRFEQSIAPRTSITGDHAMRQTRTRPSSRVRKKGRVPRSNDERFAATRAELVASARRLFARHGYVATATDDLVASAGTTRGALYYHFNDKRDAFRAVFEQVAGEIAAHILARDKSVSAPLERLLEGCEGFLVKCLDPQVARIYLLDGPAVLGWSQWRKLDTELNVSALEKAVARVLGPAVAAGIVQLVSTAISGLLNEVALLAAAEPAAVKQSVLLQQTRAMIAGLLRGVRTRGGVSEA